MNLNLTVHCIIKLLSLQEINPLEKSFVIVQMLLNHHTFKSNNINNSIVTSSLFIKLPCIQNIY